jgi:hypothetical protein
MAPVQGKIGADRGHRVHANGSVTVLVANRAPVAEDHDQQGDAAFDDSVPPSSGSGHTD